MAPDRPWRDIVTLLIDAAALVIVARWAWRQVDAARRDVLAQVERHHARRDALARATAPRAVR